MSNKTITFEGEPVQNNLSSPKNILPDVILYRILVFLTGHTQSEFKKGPQNKEESLLWSVLQDNKIDKQSFFEEIKSLFTTSDKTKNVKIEFGYDLSQVPPPAIYIVMNSETDGPLQALGMGQGKYDPIIVSGQGAPIFEKSFQATYSLLIVGSNKSETIGLYHLYKMLLVAIYPVYATEGFVNMSISGQDLNINEEIVPRPVFSKMITLSFGYNLRVRSTSFAPIINKLKISLKSME